MILKLVILITGLSAVLAVNFFRKDYTYNKERDAFYKVIWSEEGNFFDAAFMTCNDEESQLFYPKYDDEWIVINNLVKALPEMPNTSMVLVGIRDEVGYGQYLTVDGHIVTVNINQNASLPQDCVVMDLSTGTLNATSCIVPVLKNTPRLFVCKKLDDSPCPTIDKDYKYNKETKKCYKVNRRRKSWKHAMQTCYMEGGLLVVVESDVEATIIKEILSHSSETRQEFHSGFRKRSGEFYTLKGKMLEDSFFNTLPPPPMYSQKPNSTVDDNLDWLGADDCGVLIKMYSAGYGRHLLYTSSTSCQNLKPFICEIQARF